MSDQVANAIKVTVSGTYDADDVTITLRTGHGAELPNPSGDNYNLIWWDTTDYDDAADDPNLEIVRVTAKAGDVITVTRAQEGTGASLKNTSAATYKMVMGVTAKTITDLIAETTAVDADLATHAALSNVHHTEAHSIASHNDTTVTGAELNADHSKLAGIETAADVTDAVNVDAAGAVMNTDKNVANGVIGIDGSGDASLAGNLQISHPTSNSNLRLWPDAGNNWTFGANATTDEFFIYDATNAANRFSIDSAGNITISGTVDGRDIAADGTKLDTVASAVNIWLPAEAAYLPATNPAGLIEALGVTTCAGFSYLTFDDTTSEHAVWRIPIPDYDGGNIVVTAHSKVATAPAAIKTLQYNILTIGLANSEEFESASTVDTTVNISHSLDAVTAVTDIMIASATIDPANVATDDLLVIELSRDVSSDDLSGDGELIGILIEYVRV